MLRLAFLALLAVTSVACGPSLTFTRYRVALDEQGAQLCARRCEVTNDYDERGLFQCLAQCPGVEVAAGRKCTSTERDQPPAALCYTAAVESKPERTSDGDTETAGALVGLVGAILETAIDSAVSSDDDDVDEADEAESDQEEEPPAPKRTARRTRQPAEPKRARRPASPTRR